ncbi:MAG: hypothetical protein GTO53_00350, partial [Planctomycetales bacterium]|nr:hypothetical protein [Planctomycetales bacterium]NIM07631.1 hypothetical protein [Planctomycetales bacterium]NIN07137.1 hypothetical protein [Planctomycetales bacterium]NIN76231.1 hypothetical protein [Planctomycetales bacterium]NIO33453.1 hypothetical protein [Planctomycetales bacterium]
MRAQLTTTIVLVGTMLVAGQAAAQFRYRYAQLPPYPSQTMPYLPQTLEGGTTSTVAPGFDPYAPGAGAAAPAPAVTLPGATAVPPTITLPGVDPLAPTTTCPPTGCPPLQPVLVDLGPRWRVFGEFLYLRAGDAAMTTYAVPVNGPILPPPPPSLPVGPYATIDPDREPGFRAGVGWFTSKISEWSGTYTWLESQTTDSVSV